MTWLAPCGHPGTPIIGTYVACHQCDDRHKPVKQAWPMNELCLALRQDPWPDMMNLATTGTILIAWCTAKAGDDNEVAITVTSGISVYKPGVEARYWRLLDLHSDPHRVAAQGKLCQAPVFVVPPSSDLLNSFLEDRLL